MTQTGQERLARQTGYNVTRLKSVRHSNQKQSGLVLITCILIIAVVSAMAISLIDSSYSQYRKTQHYTESEQLHQLARAVEEFGVQILYWDNWFDALIWQKDRIDYDLPRPSLETENPLGYDPHNDSRFETWSYARTPEFLRADLADEYLPKDILYITDLNRFFNINNLHFSNSDHVSQAFNANVRIFRSLLSQVIDQDIDIDKFANDVIDWLDHDNDSRSEILLTEEDVYRRAGSSYRPANRPINSIGELEHVLGMTPQIMDRLSEFVVSLPVYSADFAPQLLAFSPEKQIGDTYSGPDMPELTKININTCPPELLVALFALNDNSTGLATALEKQGYFQNINKTQALDMKTVFRHGDDPGYSLTPEKANKSNVLSSPPEIIDLVAAEYSEFFLIESFFQRKNGATFNHESLVYKDRVRFNYLPVVIQRQFDWLPLGTLSGRDSNDSM